MAESMPNNELPAPLFLEATTSAEIRGILTSIVDQKLPKDYAQALSTDTFTNKDLSHVCTAIQSLFEFPYEEQVSNPGVGTVNEQVVAYLNNLGPDYRDCKLPSFVLLWWLLKMNFEVSMYASPVKPSHPSLIVELPANPGAYFQIDFHGSEFTIKQPTLNANNPPRGMTYKLPQDPTTAEIVMNLLYYAKRWPEEVTESVIDRITELYPNIFPNILKRIQRSIPSVEDQDTLAS